MDTYQLVFCARPTQTLANNWHTKWLKKTGRLCRYYSRINFNLYLAGKNKDKYGSFAYSKDSDPGLSCVGRSLNQNAPL
jgi:hypothetical protein